MSRRDLRWLVSVAAATAALSACTNTASDAAPAVTSLSAETASFDLAAGVEQRYLLGLFSDDGGAVVDGSVTFDFTYLDGDVPGDTALEGLTAEFVPVAGSDERAISNDPHVAEPGEGTGAYRATNVVFDRPGNWQVRATVEIDGKEIVVDDAFEVQPEQLVPAVGDPAPRTVNSTVEDRNVDGSAIDSRAENGILPDPELHHQTVADAIASGRATMIVVSTPTYCISRFCGPITDTVQDLVGRFPDVNFVHLEVWNDYETQAINAAAAEWIMPTVAGGEGTEPWVFLVAADGTIAERWDNVTNSTELSAAIERLT